MSIIEKKSTLIGLIFIFSIRTFSTKEKRIQKLKEDFYGLNGQPQEFKIKKQRMNQYGITQTQKKTVEKMLMIS